MPVPPQKAVIHIDPCAFDPKYYPENKAAEEFFCICKNRKDVITEISYSVQKEIDHPKTPFSVKKIANSTGYTIETGLTEEEKDLLRKIQVILAGNGRVERIRKDAEHVFEAHKHANYFVTTDNRILRKKEELFKICLNSLSIVKPSEILSLIKIYANRLKHHV